MKERAGLSQRAYAAHRGVSLRAVQRALEDGRITALPDGSIDAEKADADWESNTDATKRPKSASGRLTEVRTAKEYTTTRLLDLKLKQATAELVPLNEVKILFRATSSNIFNAFMNLGNAVAPRLVGQRDITRITNTINEEVRRMIKEYANDAEQEITSRFQSVLGLGDNTQ